MVVTVPPRISISELMGILKGKTAIASREGQGCEKSRTGGIISGVEDIALRQ